MYYIYAHIVPNGKMYVGMTKNTKKRWGAQKYKGCSKFYKAILEYGWKNIEHVILETTNDIIEARGLEKEYILKYNTIDNGYNIFNDIRKEVRKSVRKTPLPIYQQYSLDGNFIREYVGNKELRKYGFINTELIRECCNGRTKTSYKFIWKIKK